MAKHLAPDTKHELKNEKRIKPERTPVLRHEKAAWLDRMPTLHPAKRPWLPIVFAVVLLIALRFLPLEGWMIPVGNLIPFLLAGVGIAVSAAGKLKERDFFCNELLTLLAAVLLFVLAHYFEAVLLLILTSICHMAEEYLRVKSRRELDEILNILPDSAQLVTDEGIARVSPDEVRPGDVILVSAGERIPLDGVILEGITTVDTAAISGQRSPWAVNEGYRVYSGCINLTSDIRVRVTRPFSHSTVNKLVRAAKSAVEFPSEQEHNAATVNAVYSPAMLVMALVIGVLVPLFRGGWAEYALRAAVVLIAARTVADVFSIPVAYRSAIALAAKMGVFIKGEDCIEAVARTETMVFDKTGTITEGRYTVTDVFPVKMSEQQLLNIAAMAESFSRHPIAAAIREAAGKVDSRLLKVIKVKEIPGRGVSAFVGERQVYVGNAALMTEHGVPYSVPDKSGSAVHVAVDSRYCGYIMVADKVRRRAFDALEGIRISGVDKMVLLTGDVHSVARPLASRLNFDMLRAELKPEEKARAIDYLMDNKGEHASITFVGAGDNDGGVMTKADVGIAMGALGSDMALAAADILIMDRDIMKVPRIVSLCKQVYSVSWQNFFGGMIMHLLILVFGLLGTFSPLAAEVLSAIIYLAVLANTMRVR